MSANPRTQYSYDPKGQLIKSNNQTFAYDKAGNHLNNQSIYDPITNQLQHNASHTFSYAPQGHFLASSGHNRGNLRTKTEKQTGKQTIYTYNTLNQLIKVQTPTDTLEYSYDAFGRRVSKTHNNTTHHYLYDNQNIIAILNAS